MNFFRIYPEHGFVHTWTTGSDFETLLGFYKEVAAHPDFSKDYVGLADISSAELDFSPEQAIEMGKFVLESNYTNARWVFLVSEPAATALSVVYQDIVKDLHELFVVSSLEAASEYLGLDLKSIIAE